MAVKLGSFEVLRGGSGNDSFVFDNNAVYTGHIDGQGGKDTLDYSQYQTAVTLKLTALGSIDGFDGVTVGLGSFSNIDRYVGSNASGDVLTGLDENTIWNLQGFKLYTSGDHSLDLAGVEILRGGNGDDTFIIKGSINFLLDGGVKLL
jgi:Ca2+-binding RTX toxin-like protein